MVDGVFYRGWEKERGIRIGIQLGGKGGRKEKNNETKRLNREKNNKKKCVK